MRNLKFPKPSAGDSSSPGVTDETATQGSLASTQSTVRKRGGPSRDADSGRWEKPGHWSDRFWSYVEKTDGCWWWRGSIWQRYGYLWVDGKSQRTPRLSWSIHFGEIPAGMFVCHRCDNPLCVRPDHLFLGTAAENNRDREAKGRGGKRHGELNPMAKLTSAQVDEIRALAGSVTHAELADRFGVSRGTISRTVNGVCWSRERKYDHQHRVGCRRCRKIGPYREPKVRSSG